MAPRSEQLHFVLVPLPAQGHMIPMIDMAKLLAHHGVSASLVTTPLNAARFASTILRARASGLLIQTIEVPFPSRQAGLPLGLENLDSLPSPDLLRRFYAALDGLEKPVEKHLRTCGPPPSCIISDKCIPWTARTAHKFGVPRVVFHGMCCFALLSSFNVRLHGPHLSARLGSEGFEIPGMPMRVKITREQLPGSFVALPDLDDIREEMREAESSAYGVVVNSFEEVEGGCVEEYRKVVNKKVWCIGPVCLWNREIRDKFERGNKSSIDETMCMQWLDTKKPKSVLFACLGSQCRLVPAQLAQLGLGLKESGHPFIWVIKTGTDRSEELENWLADEKFEERVRGRGLVIKGWAPQVLILSHPSVGGFLTHCGWNSTIEGVCSGVPMVTWPMFAEQFLNEKLVVEVLGIGVRVGVERPVRWGDEEKAGVLVGKEGVGRAIETLMGGGEEGEMRRMRSMELRVVAKSKMEDGGSAHCNILAMIRDIMEFQILTRQ